MKASKLYSVIWINGGLIKGKPFENKPKSLCQWFKRVNLDKYPGMLLITECK